MENRQLVVHGSSIMCPMRWSELFRHLEEGFSSDRQEPGKAHRSGSVGGPQALSLCVAAKLSGRVVTVGLGSGDVLHVAPRAVGPDWFSGLVGGEKGSGVVIPFRGLEWLEDPSSGAPAPREQTARAQLGDVFSDLMNRGVHVVIRTAHGDSRGVLVEVGGDFIDVAPSHSRAGHPVRRFARHAIVAVFTGESRWG